MTFLNFFLNTFSLEKVLLVIYIFFTPFWIRARIIEEVTPPAPISERDSSQGAESQTLQSQVAGQAGIGAQLRFK